MGKAPDIKRITKEDFPEEYRDLIDKLSFPINSYFEQVRNLFTKGIDFDNLTRELITLKVQTGNNSKPLSAVTFKTVLAGRIKGINVISANITSSTLTYLTQAPFISFSQNGNIVTVLNIAGLGANTTYELLLETIS